MRVYENYVVSYFLTSFYDDMVESRNTISFIVNTIKRYRSLYLSLHLTVLVIIVLLILLLRSYTSSIIKWTFKNVSFFFA